MHQINIEHLAQVAFIEESDQGPLIYPDTMIGTDRIRDSIEEN